MTGNVIQPNGASGDAQDITSLINTSVNNTGFSLTIESANKIGSLVIVNILLSLNTGTAPINLSGKDLFGFSSSLKAKNNYSWVAGIRLQLYEALLYIDNDRCVARFTGDAQNTALQAKPFVGSLIWVTES